MKYDKMEKLILKRKTENYTQKEMSEIIGIPVNTYRHYEYGERRMSIETLKKISELFKCKVDDLI